MTYRARTLLKAAAGLVLLVALVLYATFGAGPAEQTPGTTLGSQPVFPDMDKSDIVRVEVVAGARRTVAVRDDARTGWRLEQPVQDEADPVAIGALLETMEGITARRRLVQEEAGPAADYGLDAPRGQVVLSGIDDKRFCLLVGKQSDFDNSLYVKRQDGQEVLVVDGGLRQALLKEPFDLRRKILLRFNLGRVDRLGLQRGPLFVRLVRREGIWHLVEPIEDRADQDRVERMINALHAMRARSYPPPDKLSLASYGLDPPAILVVVGTGGDTAEVGKVALGRGVGKMIENRCYARRLPAGPVAEIRAHHLRALEQTPFDLRAKSPVRFEREAVARIKSTGRGRLVVLERDPARKQAGEAPRWSLVAPRAVPARQHAVESLLHALAGLRALRFGEEHKAADLARYGLQPAARTITLFDADGDELGWLSIGKRTGEGTWVSGSHRPMICLVDSRKIDRIPDDPAVLADLPAEEKP